MLKLNLLESSLCSMVHTKVRYRNAILCWTVCRSDRLLQLMLDKLHNFFLFSCCWSSYRSMANNKIIMFVFTSALHVVVRRLSQHACVFTAHLIRTIKLIKCLRLFWRIECTGCSVSCPIVSLINSNKQYEISQHWPNMSYVQHFVISKQYTSNYFIVTEQK